MTRPSLARIATLTAIAVLAVPGAALAKGGGGGGGGGGSTPAPAPAPGPAGAACATITASNPDQIDTPHSHKGIALDFKVSNCSNRSESLTTTLLDASHTTISMDPFEQDVCVGTAFTAAPIVLGAGRSTSFAIAPRYPFCGRDQWGPFDEYSILYDVSIRETGTAPVLSTTGAMIRRVGGA